MCKNQCLNSNLNKINHKMEYLSKLGKLTLFKV